METPIITRSVSAGTRVYYFDLHEDTKGQPYIAVSEIPVDKAPGNKKRQRIFIHSDYVEAFKEALGEVADAMKCQ